MAAGVFGFFLRFMAQGCFSLEVQMVTKQEQLKHIAEKCESWPYMGLEIIMSCSVLGAIDGAPSPGCHFVSFAEWKQERDKMQKQNDNARDLADSAKEIEKIDLQINVYGTKKDNSWHERGEMPPVGCECEAMRDGKWVAVEVLRHRVNNVGFNVAAVMDCTSFSVFWSVDFRPIRTEREKAIDEMAELIGVECQPSPINIGSKRAAEILYDAGYRKQ